MVIMMGGCPSPVCGSSTALLQGKLRQGGRGSKGFRQDQGWSWGK